MQNLGTARKARLSIPKVNQNPGVGAAHAFKMGLGPAMPTKFYGQAQGNGMGPAMTTAQPSNTAATASTTSAPTDPFKVAAEPPVKPGEFRIPQWTPQKPGEADPRDATYWTNVAKLKFNDEQKYGENLREQSMADSSYNDALQTAIRNRATQQRELGENAIRGNLGASGWLDRNEALQTTAYTQDRAHASLSKEQEDQARQAARNALQEGWGIDTAAELAEAGGRYAAHSKDAADKEEPGPAEAGGGQGSGAAGSTKQRAGVGKAHALTQSKGPGVGRSQVVNQPYYKAALGKARKARR